MISVNYKDPRPIYEQIKYGLRKLMAEGALPAGGKLPSVRELAGSLAINPNTIQRAYRELEAEGRIHSVQGKGSFVSEDFTADREKIEAAFTALDRAAGELLSLGVCTEDIRARITNGGEKHD